MTREKLNHAILRAASWVAPKDERPDLLAEWTAELWYVERSGGQSTQFCCGAFRDAWWRRRNAATEGKALWVLQTPMRCLTFLAAMAGLAMLVAFEFPATNGPLGAPPYPNVSDLVMVSANGMVTANGKPVSWWPSVSIGEYRRLTENGSRWFSGAAFYQPTALSVRIADKQTILWTARATEDLFDVLGVPMRRVPGHLNLVLSEEAWTRLDGRSLQVDGRPVVIAAVLPAKSWRLPGKFEAWLLEDEEALTTLPDTAVGYVVGRIRKSAPHAATWHVSIPRLWGAMDQFDCSPVNEAPPGITFVAILLISCLLLPATTILSMGGYGASHLPWSVRIRRWLFLTLKGGLALTAIIFIAIDLSASGAAALFSQTIVVGTVATLRWILVDQRRRCPVCLRLLANPVRIGRPSQTFLEWYGTELMCTKGHGLLHVPEVKTSCYGAQQWHYLDGSWSSLFTEPAGAPLK